MKLAPLPHRRRRARPTPSRTLRRAGRRRPTDADLVFELVVSALRLARDHADRGDLKIANAALKEMRYAFHVFAPYRAQRKVAIFGSARTAARRSALRPGPRGSRPPSPSATGWSSPAPGPGSWRRASRAPGPDRAFGVSIRLPFEADHEPVHRRRPEAHQLPLLLHAQALVPQGVRRVRAAPRRLRHARRGVRAAHARADGQGPAGADRPARRARRHVLGDVARLRRRRAARARATSRRARPVPRRVTDDVDAAVDEVTRLLLELPLAALRRRAARAAHAPRARRRRALDGLNDEFADIVVRGRIERIDATPAEIADDDHVDLERIALLVRPPRLGPPPRADRPPQRPCAARRHSSLRAASSSGCPAERVDRPLDRRGGPGGASSRRPRRRRRRPRRPCAGGRRRGRAAAPRSTGAELRRRRARRCQSSGRSLLRDRCAGRRGRGLTSAAARSSAGWRTSSPAARRGASHTRGSRTRRGPGRHPRPPAARRPCGRGPRRPAPAPWRCRRRRRRSTDRRRRSRRSSYAAASTVRTAPVCVLHVAEVARVLDDDARWPVGRRDRAGRGHSHSEKSRTRAANAVGLGVPSSWP